MSAEPALEVVGREQLSASTEPVSAATEPLIRPRTWPVTMLTSWTLSLALAAALALLPFASLATTTSLLLAAPAVLVGAFVARLTFDSRSVRSRGRLSWRVGASAAGSAATATATVGTSVLVAGGTPGVVGLAGSFLLAATVLVVAAAVRGVEVRYLRSSRRVFLVATEEQRCDIAREIQRHDGMELVGFWNVMSASPAAALAAQLASARATMLVLSTEAGRNHEIVAVASEFNRSGRRVRDLSSFYERHFHKVPLSELTESWFLFDVAGIHRARAYGLFKRFAEVTIALVALLIAAPGMLVIAAATRTSGPVFFRQRRVGRDHESFTLIKFRTMATSGDDGPEWADAHAHRVTRVGRVLRRYRLDELPQLWNVLRGDMSLVGPRPEQVPLVERLSADIDYYTARHVVRPGLTGWAQVNHGYGGSRQGTLEKLQYDFFYVRHQGLRLDLLVLARTGRAMIGGQSEPRG